LSNYLSLIHCAERFSVIYLIVTLGFVILLALIWFLAGMMNHAQAPDERQQPAPAAAPKGKLPCILCGADLRRGETLKSRRYTDGSEVHVFGCGYCYGQAATRVRRCPNCKSLMKDDDYLRGEMWKKNNGKMHLHISGCARCAGTTGAVRPSRPPQA
jgi:hypothetical protein